MSSPTAELRRYAASLGWRTSGAGHGRHVTLVHPKTGAKLPFPRGTAVSARNVRNYRTQLRRLAEHSDTNTTHQGELSK